jgi:DGQHR domain-containing protein
MLSIKKGRLAMNEPTNVSGQEKRRDTNRLANVRELQFLAFKSKNLDTECYFGTAPLAELAIVSEADVFDQDTNRQGLQRDLSPSHAAAAYDYVSRAPDRENPRAYPEIVLNVRDRDVLRVEAVEGHEPHVRLIFDVEAIRRARSVKVSRVDGNHRLYYVAGDERRQPVYLPAPFQIHIGLTKEQETALFVDINANQKGLNTSHLTWLVNRLSPEEVEMKEHPERWIAIRLAEDPASPWHGIIHMGGSKVGAREQGLIRPVNLKSLEGGVKRTLGKSAYIYDLTDIKAQYVLIRTFWQAVKEVFAEEWSNPKEFLILRNLGVITLSILAGTVIDRCLARQKMDVKEMARYLRQCSGTWNWRAEATGDRSVSGMSGNRAALIVAGRMAEELSDEEGINFGDITRQLVEAAASI